MAVFSNLEGTMKKSFILGKNGAKLSTNGSVLSVHNYQGTSLIPISAADPLDGTHLVTLSYFNSHSGGGSGNALRGTVDPEPSLGTDGDVYYKVDATNILQIYIKDNGIWKPTISSQSDSQYVTTIVASPSDFTQVGSDYVYTLSSTTHGRGSNIVVQLQGAGGDVQNADLQVDSSGNITITSDSLPTSNISLVLIGETTLTSPYNKLINKEDWVTSGDDFTLSIQQSVHGQVPGAIFIAVYENSVDSATSTSPYKMVAVQTSIDNNANIILTSSVKFSGKVVISGK